MTKLERQSLAAIPLTVLGVLCFRYYKIDQAEQVRTRAILAERHAADPNSVESGSGAGGSPVGEGAVPEAST